MAGNYLFTCGFSAFNLASSMTQCDIFIETSIQQFRMIRMNPFAIGVPGGPAGSFDVCGTAYAPMDVGDTAFTTITISGGGGDTASVSGGANARSWFSGVLINAT